MTHQKTLSFILFIVFLFPSPIIANGFSTPSQSQTITSNSNEPSPGYTLFAPEFSLYTYLIDLDGNVIHSWKSNYVQALGTYLTKEGNLVRSCLPWINPRFGGGGISGRIEMYRWDGTLLWEFDYSNDQHCLHHDIEILPNGNILMIAWEYKSLEESINAGRNPSQLPNNQLWPDHVIEVEPTFPSGGNIVWEWHVWDHLIQDFDSSKENYGVIADHPELVDINYGVAHADWTHINAIDYNEDLDQIILSCRNQNELWIIDHSTTTQEAAGHTGGRYGKGGDILYRWGNPQVYDAGTSDDKVLFQPHDIHWIEQGCPGYGNILIFNNGGGRPDGPYSTVDEISPPINANGSYILTPGEAYQPSSLTWQYAAENETDFFASHLSGAQRLPNGNTLICHGTRGYFFEINEENRIVWDFQNEDPPLSNKHVFKIKRYPPEYPGLSELFDNKPPQTPSTPTGPYQGETGIPYTYTTYTTDPNQDDLYYLFDWDDGTDSGWIGPISSGTNIAISHQWDQEGNYEVRVKAKDLYDAESLWSDPLPVTMPKTYHPWGFFLNRPFIAWLIEIIIQN